MPELEKGNMVIMDRFIDSSVAYQGTGRGLDQDEIAWLNAYATDGYKPDVTLLLSLIHILSGSWHTLFQKNSLL